MCAIVHILTNKQKLIAFQEIEKSVATHLEMNEETIKQVNTLIRTRYLITVAVNCYHGINRLVIDFITGKVGRALILSIT